MGTDILQGTVTNGDSVPLVYGMVVRISGNNVAVRALGPGVSVAYVAATPPTMDAGLGVFINGGNVALGSLPVNLSLTNGSAVYAL